MQPVLFVEVGIRVIPRYAARAGRRMLQGGNVTSRTGDNQVVTQPVCVLRGKWVRRLGPRWAARGRRGGHPRLLQVEQLGRASGHDLGAAPIAAGGVQVLLPGMRPGLLVKRAVQISLGDKSGSQPVR